jgi:hypothetical protein
MARRLLLAAAALVLAVPAIALAQATALTGTVGPGFTISLKNPDGSLVTHLDPGAFVVNVDDLGDLHNFHLTGPGVDMSTSVPALEKVSWQLTLVEGRYRFQCDAHPTQMEGLFTVGNPPTPPPPPPPAAPAPKRLTASVGPGATIRLSAGSARRGRYILTVNDKTAKENFHLTGPGVNRKTGVAFRGRARWNLNLKKGLYRFRSDANAKLSGTLRVT